PDLAEEEGVSRLGSGLVHEPPAVECKIATEANEVRAVLARKGEACRSGFYTSCRYQPRRLVRRGCSLRDRGCSTLHRGRGRAGQCARCLRYWRCAGGLTPFLCLCYRTCGSIRRRPGSSLAAGDRAARGTGCGPIGRRLLAFEHFELVLQGLDAPVLLL